jgi:hypothetical protein
MPLTPSFDAFPMSRPTGSPFSRLGTEVTTLDCVSADVSEVMVFVPEAEMDVRPEISAEANTASVAARRRNGRPGRASAPCAQLLRGVGIALPETEAGESRRRGHGRRRDETLALPAAATEGRGT